MPETALIVRQHCTCTAESSNLCHLIGACWAGSRQFVARLNGDQRVCLFDVVFLCIQRFSAVVLICLPLEVDLIMNN